MTPDRHNAIQNLTYYVCPDPPLFSLPSTGQVDLQKDDLLTSSYTVFHNNSLKITRSKWNLLHLWKLQSRCYHSHENKTTNPQSKNEDRRRAGLGGGGVSLVSCLIMVGPCSRPTLFFNTKKGIQFVDEE